ncbi:MAG: LPS-assembly protein LptD, partial [Deltaproteobacteria bacterium]|nr:LPS-assembly protein LptD [Deltaproteobacteria bacterium]
MAGKWRYVVLGFLGFIFIFFTPYSFAKKIPSKVKGPIKIQADKLIYNRDKNTYTAQGHVVIKSQKSVLKADKIVINNSTKDVEATGHVQFTDGEDELTCTHMRLNLLTHLGTIYNGTLKTKKGNYRITASRAERLGPERYRIYDGTFTTCNAKKPAWQFKAKKMDVTVEGFAVARDAKFYAGGIPILYSPYLIYPTKRKRQTGFLFPIFGGSSHDGVMIGESFFWAISEDKDATFTETYYGDRGFKHGLEFRYARTSDSNGQLNLHYIDDDKYHGNRWAVIYRHDEYLKNGFYAKADINRVSDKDYLVDFSEDIPGKSATDARREQLLKSKVSFGKNWNKYSFSG